MKSIITSLLFIVTTMCFCQTNAVHKNYIHLFSDSIIYGSHVSFESGFMIEPHLNIDDQKYKLDDVKFYDDGFGLKGNVMRATYGKPLFALRTIKGKLNLFETTQKTFDIVAYTNTNPYIYKTELKKGYYNKGTGFLKKINYKNLSVDLGDNYESSQELSEMFRLKKQQTLFTTIGSVGCLIGFITYNYSDQYNINSIYTPITSFIIGTASYLLALRKEKLKLKHLKASIEIYNK